MHSDTLYISPEFNPHSLARDWGLFLRGERPAIFQFVNNGLSDFRHQWFFCVLANLSTDQPNVEFSRLQCSKVTTDGISENANQLCDEVGFDVLALALLADVPIHRPIHIDHNSLLGHWRWLRSVWRWASNRAKETGEASSMQADPEIRTMIAEGKNNLAIAALRRNFKDLQSGIGSSWEYLSFLANLTLFCPFIGTELLWRQGLISASKQRA
jgi:leucyl-tRNA synthetase